LFSQQEPGVQILDLESVGENQLFVLMDRNQKEPGRPGRRQLAKAADRDHEFRPGQAV
jgi:hypothetical protein